MNQSFRYLFAILALVVMAFFTASAQVVKVVKYSDLEKLRRQPHDTLYVVNFWATWCKPCIKELPYFETVNKQYKGQPVQVVLVSMDAPQDLEKRVHPFVQKRALQSRLLLLDESDPNSWIDRLEPKWSGAIPATMLFNNKRKQYAFVERELSEAELQKLIVKYKP
jgi:thiol-disulfide isomerase/thioredoxin